MMEKAAENKLTEAHKVALSLLILEDIFVLHHLYGEYFVYRDGLRLTSIWISLPVLAATLISLWAAGRGRALWIFAALSIGPWLLFVGLIEGSGFHILLNILTWLDISEDTLIRIFSRPTSGDAINEITGVMELLAAIPFGLHTSRFLGHRRKDS